MSLRPRFAGDGRVYGPRVVSILRSERPRADIGDIVGEHYPEAAMDPFERTPDGLLLAESFARFDFRQPRKAQQWYMTHGVVDLASLFPAEVPDRTSKRLRDEDYRFHDTLDEVLVQQRNVRWHLLALARLSTEREGADPPLPGWEAHEGWDPSWSQPALVSSDGPVLWLGAATDYEAHITSEMQRFEHFEDVERTVVPEGRDLSRVSPQRLSKAWWPRARAAWQRIVADGIPILWVPRSNWRDHWSDYEIDGATGRGRRPWARRPHGRRPRGRLSADWHGLLELERRLIEPYIRLATKPEVEVVRDGSWRRPPPGGRRNFEWDQPLLVRERRWWRSLLAPVYLQLLEGLRRISEGSAGAAVCRECEQPILVLDARRSTYCNDRERFRYSQRQRRKRLASTTTKATER